MAALLRGLDGRRAQRAVLGDADRDGLDRGAVVPGARRAARRGPARSTSTPPTCWRPTRARPPPRAPPRSSRPRSAARAVRSGGPGASAVVVVEGANRVGVPLAAVLAASGVGRVSVRDTGLVDRRRRDRRRAERGRRGPAPGAGGGRRDPAGQPAHRPAPAARRRPPTSSSSPVRGPPRTRWPPPSTGAQVPHLVATVRGETGVVGPLVVPGVTSCLRCADLHRRDADPRWPRLAAQLTADRAAAQRSHRHLPAHRRHRGPAGAGLPGRQRRAGHAGRDRRAAAAGPPAARAAVAAAPRLRLRRGLREHSDGAIDHSRGRRRDDSSRRDRRPAGNNGRLTEPTSSPETTRQRPSRARGPARRTRE